MSAASKLLNIGTALLGGPRAVCSAPSLLFPKPFLSSQSLRFPRYCSSVAVDTVTPVGTEAPHHPWPEWMAFVDRLTAKGYFSQPLPLDEPDSVYGNMNLLKDACLNFARDRYDLFNSLSTKDIEVIVGGGCPNLLRKAVNSAKRLRAYVRLDEGDVCGACNLRGSCDRAYMIVQESEADARTVDIVRILLFYALDPLVISRGEKPVGRELVESSARKLLSELLDLSETPPDPALAKPAVKVPKRKEQTLSVADEMSKNVEMKRGDWICPKCNFINFSRNIRCLKCKADGPKRVRGGDVEMKKGDWNCTKCEFMNFASNRKCLRCNERRPKRQLNPGEWECPSCDFLNYRRNTVCLKCNCERPKEAASSEYEEQIWRRPQ